MLLEKYGETQAFASLQLIPTRVIPKTERGKGVICRASCTSCSQNILVTEHWGSSWALLPLGLDPRPLGCQVQKKQMVPVVSTAAH